jgi:uncharacterized protein
MGTLARRRAILDALPGVACKGLCASSCRDLTFSILDLLAIRLAYDVDPIHSSPDERTCGALVDGQCSIHDERPMICRLWGVVDDLACPHGCEAEPITLQQVVGTLIALESVHPDAQRYVRLGTVEPMDASIARAKELITRYRMERA